jgi:hypothetical protein
MENRGIMHPAISEPGVDADDERQRTPYNIDDEPEGRSDAAAKGHAWAAMEDALHEELGNREVDRLEQGAVGPWDGPMTGAVSGPATGPLAFPNTGMGAYPGGLGAGIVVLPEALRPDHAEQADEEKDTNEWYPPSGNDDTGDRETGNSAGDVSVVGGGPWR